MLDAATDVFSERGFHAASMDEIASRVNVTKPMLYAYFGSKEGLYKATVNRAGNYLVDMVDTLMAETDALKRLETGANSLLDFVFSQRAAWSVVYNERMGPEGMVDISEFRERVGGMVAHTLVDAARQQSGEVRTPVSEEESLHAWPYAIGLLGSCESMLRWWTKSGDLSEEQCRALCLELVDAHFAAYLKAGSRIPRAS